ncbi:hypothetical protein MNBD_GAMMA13-1489 [hydrothermal vent metagenome]|uniref:TonB-dependent receptor n=1 Tax=hydrothermal vent metagenome TaxID=652676 RepID=A0A3B0XY53_9ZZZZ
MSTHFKRHLPKVIGVAIVVLVGLGTITLVKNFLASKPVAARKMVRQITLVQPPPPPPPPEDKPLPEPELEEEVEIPEPEPDMEELPDLADEQPLGDALGLDAEGGAGSDAFGLIGRKGGRGLLAGLGDPKVVYAGRWIERIHDALDANPELKSRAFSVPCVLRVSENGSVADIRLRGSTGDKKIDAEILETVRKLVADGQLPPPGLGAIRFRIRVSL